MSNKIKAQQKKKKVHVCDLIPAAYHAWDSDLKASWCVNNALWCQKEGIEVDAPGIDVRFEGDGIVIKYEVPGLTIEQAEEHIDECLSALERTVPTNDRENQDFWQGVIDYLYRSITYLREETQL